MASAFKRKSDRRKKGSKWVASFFDHEVGKWRSRTGFTDREATLELARRLEKDSARRKEGLDDPVDSERLRGPPGGVQRLRGRRPFAVASRHSNVFVVGVWRTVLMRFCVTAIAGGSR
jgi:hypothetical protein